MTRSGPTPLQVISQGGRPWRLDGVLHGRQMRLRSLRPVVLISKWGNNEVYELLTLGRVDYQPEKDQLGIEDHTIYLINELGQKSSTRTIRSGYGRRNQGSADRAGCHRAEINRRKKRHRGWPNRHRSGGGSLDELGSVRLGKNGQLRRLIGSGDIHKRKSLRSGCYRSVKRWGISSFTEVQGPRKTTFLQTIAMDLALTMCLLDFGTMVYP